MPLRVRCPECKTVLDVPAGVRPTCPKCGFAGRSNAGKPKAAPKAKSGAKFTRATSPPAAAPAAPQAEVTWGETEAPGEWPAEAEEWPAAEAEAPAEPGEWPAEGEAEAWQPEGSADAWAPAAEAPPAPAKKGWFGRKK